MSRFGILTEFTARGRQRLRRGVVLGATMTMALVLSGCGDIVPSTNTYPVDFFSEMHYHKSWDAGEPDGWNPPEGSVPITGGEVAYEEDEAADLENPFGGQVELGQQVFELNCQHCHGPEGNGESAIAGFFEGYDAPRPPNLQEATGDRSDGELFYIVTNGLGEHMPAFQRLLTQEERWAVTEYLREIEQ